MNALIGEYLPLANAGNLPERAYYSDGYKPQPDPSHPESEAVKLNISPDAQMLLAQTEGEFLASSKTDKKGTADNKKQSKSSNKELKSEDSGDEETIRQLQARDAEVRAHELKHLASAGQYASGGIVYDYQVGPDGRLYAVGGHVNVNTGSVSGDPEATLQKARSLRMTAMAVGDPSAADAGVAQEAAQMESDAMADIAAENRNASMASAQIAKAYGLASDKKNVFSISA